MHIFFCYVQIFFIFTVDRGWVMIYNTNRKIIYLNLKNTILTGCLEGYKNPTLMRELRGLRESAKKIEKGKGYTDDMSDALAGALWMCSQDRFYKKNNETISEIISQTGNLMTVGNGKMASTRDMRGLARQINQRAPFKRSDLGFRYGR